jgi:hypothetical protein
MKILNQLILGCTIVSASFALTIDSALAAQKTFNVKTFGAKGNGTTDDQTAIQAALNAASAVPGSEVFFPVGNYLHSGNLTGTAIELVGEGARNSKLTATTTDGQVTLTGFASAVKSLAFSTNVPNPSAAVYFNQAKGASAFNLQINDGFATGVRYDRCSTGTARNCTITTSVPQVNSLTHASSIDISNSFLFIVRDNHLSIGSGQASETTGITSRNNRQITVRENDITGMHVGISSREDSMFICVFNLVTNGLHVGIRAAKDTDLQLATNRVVFNSLDKGTDGVVSHENTKPLIRNNEISKAGVGIRSTDETNARILTNQISLGTTGVKATGDTSPTITDNRITNVNAKAIDVSSCTSVVSIERNPISNAGLTDLKTQDVILADCPSATSITLDDNDYHGNTKNLSFFIRCLQSPPVATASGNVTNTGLKTKLGP